MEYFVYILLCSDSSYYTGVTNDLNRRINEHNSDLFPKSYTHNKQPVRLLKYFIFEDVYEAISFEKQVKGWSRKKKEALIKGDVDELIRLSNHNRF